MNLSYTYIHCSKIVFLIFTSDKLICPFIDTIVSIQLFAYFLFAASQFYILLSEVSTKAIMLNHVFGIFILVFLSPSHQSATEKEQKFVPFSFILPSYHYLIDSVSCPPSYSCMKPNSGYWTLIRGFSVHLQRLMWSL